MSNRSLAWRDQTLTEIIIPIKALSLAKQRLAPLLSPSQRAGLVLAMLEDLLTTTNSIDHGNIWIVASDDAVFDIARSHGANPVREVRPTGYNEAVMLGMVTARTAGHVAVLPGDIPLATGSEIAALIAPARGSSFHIRLAPARDRQGTNGLFLSRSGLLRPAFGSNSYCRYKDASRRSGLQPQLIDAPGLALDIDTPADVDAFVSRSTGGATHTYFNALGRSGPDLWINTGAA